MTPLITSFTNPTVKRIRSLADRKHRRREGAFVVEGLQPVWRAVTSDWDIDMLVVAPELLTNDAARAMVVEQGALGIRVVEVGRDVFGRLSGRDGPAGLLAVVRGTIAGLDRFTPGGSGPILALEEAGNPGNIGTLVRSADASGAAGMVVVGHAADPLAPAAVKASMGSIFAVPMARCPAVDDLLAWAADAGRPVVAVTGHTDVGVWTAPLDPRSVLLLGSEGDGLDDDVAARCDAVVAIPMEGTAESLNLATAGSLVLYELKRRRDAG